ncbi:MAG: S-layer homology domain-containing protein [Tepidanaerobacteraceae bacterium]|jgi:hypothetical protein|nr:S-layer homology domain-containing protein [Tepidanaerobacteraceae bacterium]
MKKAKKLLITLLVLTFVLSTVSVGFAATGFSDVKDSKLAEALTRLTTLNIINGYPDGTFKPDNAITRAEFAKIVVTAVGVGSAAEYAKGITQFKDVPADYWASGYIKVASDMKIVNGRGNGVFDPNANVTYAEAITMIVRALGYEPKAQALGGYPGGYLAIAAEKDITKDVNVVNTLAATRGDIAKMIDNSLEVNLMEQTGYGTNTTYEEVNKTLLENKLSMTVVKGQVTATPDTSSALKSTQIKIDSKTYDVISGIDVEKFLGQSVKAWENNDNKIIYIEIDTDNQETVSDVLDQNTDDLYYSDAASAVGYKNSSLTGTPRLYVTNGDTEYDVADNVVVYINKTKKSLSDLEAGMYANIVITGNEVTFVDAYDWDGADMVVTDVNKSDETIDYYNSNGDTDTLDLTDADSYKITLDGKEISLSDVKPYDVLYYVEINNKYIIMDVRNSVEGKLTKVKNATVYIDGTSYDVSDNAIATLNDGKDVKAWTKDASDYDDAVNAKVMVALDLKGEVVFFSTDVKSTTNDIYGVVTGVSTFNDQIKIYANGEKVTYDFNGDVYYDYVNSAWKTKDNLKDIFDGTPPIETNTSAIPVMFRLDKNGDISELYLLDNNNVVAGLDLGKYNNSLSSSGALVFDKDKDIIKLAGTTYYPDDNIVILDSATDPDSVAWESVKASDATVTHGTITLFYDLDNKNVKFMIFDDDSYAEVQATNKVAIVTDYYYDGDWKMDVKSYSDSTTTYVVKNGNKSYVKKGDIVIFKVNADGDATNIQRAYIGQDYPSSSVTGDADNIAISATLDGNTTKRDGAYLTVNGSVYKFTSDSIVYELKITDNGAYDTIASSSYTKILSGYTVYGLADNDNNEIEVMFYVKPGKSSSNVPSTSSISAAWDSTNNAVNVTVANITGAYAVRIYDYDSGAALGGFTTLSSGTASISLGTGAVNPVFITVKVYDNKGNVLVTQKVAVQ